MKTFYIRVRGDYVNHYPIEAESLEKAEEIAKEKALDHMQNFSLDVEEYEPTWLVTKTVTKKYSCYVEAVDEEHAEDKARMTNGYEDWQVDWQDITDERGDNINIDVELCE
tara:strand:- start:1489 stop:1821 length:333 start_codon:yes stop_codon:yes gene_type:complete